MYLYGIVLAVVFLALFTLIYVAQSANEFNVDWAVAGVETLIEALKIIVAVTAGALATAVSGIFGNGKSK